MSRNGKQNGRITYTLYSIFKKILKGVLFVTVLSTVVFFLLAYSPIDPIKANLNQAGMGQVSQEQIKQLKCYWEVDTPPVIRYMNWLKDAGQLQFGMSLIYQKPVMKVIFERLPKSALLLFIAFVASFFIAVLLVGIGITKSKYRIFSGINKGIQLINYIFICIPSFWLAVLILYIGAVWLKWFPIGFSVPIATVSEKIGIIDFIYHMVLPLITLICLMVPVIYLHTIEKTKQLSEEPYIWFATARGFSRFQLYKQFLFRHSILPALMIQVTTINFLIGGSIVIESIFAYPGIGNMIVNAALKGDYPLLMGATIILAILIFIASNIGTWIVKKVDPRIQLKGLYEPNEETS